MKKNFIISILMTIVTTVIFGFIYPLVITGISQFLMKDKANGQLVTQNGAIIGSRIIGQPFSGPGYFHSRLSAAGNGYDAANTSASNLGPTNQKLIDRVKADVATNQADNPGQAVPIDLVTSSASGLDPDITPAAAEFQLGRVAKNRGASEQDLRQLIARHTEGRQWGFLGEPRVHVLDLNLELDQKFPVSKQAKLEP